MMGHQSPALRQNASSQDSIHAARHGISGAHGTLILDRFGRVLSCGEPAERIFSLSRSSLMGRRISEFIPGLLASGTSPSYHARHLDYLCTDNEWRKVDAMDATGNRFGLELSLSRMKIEGQEMFLLTLRLLEASA